MTNPAKTYTRKVGQNKGKPRVWIEGRVLLEAGFTRGSTYNVTPIATGIELTLDAEGKRKVSGKGAIPIVDLTGKTLGALQAAKRVKIERIADGVLRLTAATK